MPELTGEILSTATSDVLETMFFTSVLGDVTPGPEPLAGMVGARLTFSGALSGACELRLASRAARTIAANFLGAEESDLTDEEMGNVVCELANMVCGSVLSRLNAEAHFDLTHPDLVDTIAACPPQAMARAFDIGEGEVAVYLRIDENL